MSRRIRIVSRSIGEVYAELRDEDNPKTCEAIWRSLPIEGIARRWGDEVYFDVGLNIGLENPSQDVEVGDIAFWPPGRAVCIFFGLTPMSRCDKPRAYSPVNVFARIMGDPKVFRRVEEGERIRIERG
ncbi:MAG: cyclophilin-like family protein [Nitrososphaerota archaeon]|nr:DUF3830 family protein [Candidatus Bathyarchaeota archaeon]MCX8161648.1 DUF3830 family protein [Candidatus Bathyarchaeota archaeon]MDW8061755.1 cyclophilin-like family protein [Nitrososphaerota archaeon]